jgi:hypothetical protein
VSEEGPLGTMVVEADQSTERLVATLDAALPGCRAGRHRLVVAAPAETLASLDGRLPERLRNLPRAAAESWLATLPLDRPRLAFLPAGATYSPPLWPGLPADRPALRPWLGTATPQETGTTLRKPPVTAWAASAALIAALRPALPAGRLDLHGLITAVEAQGSSAAFRSAPALAPGVPAPAPATGEPPIRSDARVLALVPHYRCERWLGRCLAALVGQTRPPEAIAVLDDASPAPPRDIVAGFPGVTLLRARENGGPFRSVQAAIDGTDYDAYLFQDADDWSTEDRLALLLEAAERTGADLVGTQEMRFGHPAGCVSAFLYPVEAGRALIASPFHAVLHPSSLVSRALVRRAGGFATGLRYGGDYEFQIRACFAGRMVNIDRYAFFRRSRPESLSRSPETGRDSAPRLAQDTQLLAGAFANRERAARGERPDLTPFRSAAPVVLDHLAGPRLRPARDGA